MVLRLALVMLVMSSGLAQASNRSTRIAMAVALLDVAEEHCGSSIKVDPEMRKTLFLHFHESDIAGLASVISRELNAFYEDFSAVMKKDRAAFCLSSPGYAASAGYPLIRMAE
jgi:hypothetical protein